MIEDIKTFHCSECGNPIPDRDMEELIFKSVEGKIQIICPDCIAAVAKDKEINKRRQSLVVYSNIKV